VRAASTIATFALALALLACRKGAAQADAGAADAVLPGAPEPKVERTPQEEDLWARAAEGEADDLARLANREGALGLMDRGRDPRFRATAFRAAAYLDDFTVLPWLADEGASREADEAKLALDAVVDLAARPRRQVDPEDAVDLRRGCDALLALASDEKADRDRRVLAVRALRMLRDRGCVSSEAIPGAVDSK
jgi:hypothetical protein